jgi:hypothetical protein
VTTTRPAAADLEHGLALARVHLRRTARFLAGPDAADDLLAGALESLASLATVEAAQLRGEVALR